MPKCVDIEKLIIQSTIALIEQMPFYKIKITDLTKHANISRSTFYLYFDSIYDVVEKMERTFFEGMIPLTDAACSCSPFSVPTSSQQENIKNGIRFTTQYLRQNSAVFCALTGPNGDNTFRTRLARRINAWTAAVMEGNGQAMSPALRLTSEYIANGLISFQRYSLLHKDSITMEETATIGYRLIVDSLTTLNAVMQDAHSGKEGRP